jgi:nucleoside-diphosphate-sugar epimerase
VIGATGHIGTYLIPRLVVAGHDVVAVSRGQREPYHAAAEWQQVERITIDRHSAERAGDFGARIAALRADIVVDLICFELESAKHIVDALRGRVQHFLHCGTLWVHGALDVVPVEESAPRRPFGAYGVKKAAIEAWLLERARAENFPVTVLHPGHISGPGWAPINPAGNLDTDVFERLATGVEVALPDHGLALLHHVHADDVAQAFECALERRTESIGEAFHVAGPSAVTLLGYARAVAGWFDREPRLKFEPWAEWRRGVSERAAEITWDHIAHSPCASIEKARRLLGYAPRYTTFSAVRGAIVWLQRSGRVTLPREIDQT